MAKKYKFEVNLSAPANFEVTRAYGESHAITTYTDAQLQRYAEYIKYVIDSGLAEPERQIMVSFYGGGGGGAQIIEHAIKLAEHAKNYVDIFVLSIPLGEIYDQREALFTLYRLIGPKLVINSHYDWGTESEDAIDEALSDVGSKRYNLRWLFARGLGNYTTMFASVNNINNISVAFDDFLRFYNEYPECKCDVVVDPIEDAGAESFDENIVRTQLGAIAAYIEAHPKFKQHFAYRMTYANRAARPVDSLMYKTISVLAEGGIIYPGYDVPFMTAKALDDFPLGNIDEDFDVLESRRADLIAQLPESGEELSVDCSNMLRSVPWIDDDNEWSMVPSENLCKLHELLTEYLPHRHEMTGDESEQ